MSKKSSKKTVKNTLDDSVEFCVTKKQLDAIVEKRLVDEKRELIKKTRAEAVDTAMKLLFILPVEVLKDNYWPKSYKTRIPIFVERLIDYYTQWQDGKIDIYAMEKELEEIAGIKFEMSKERR